MPAAATAAARRAAAATPARATRSRAHTARRPRANASRPARARAARPAHRAPTPFGARLVPIAVGRTAGAVSGIAEWGLVYRLTRGRLWIVALTTLLVGIVAMNVLALSFNATASKTGRQADVLKREISTLRGTIAAAGVSNERVQSLAANLGLIVPDAGSIQYLTASPGDAATAAHRLASGELTAGSPSAEVAVTTAAPTTPTAPVPAAAPVTAAPPPTQAPAADTTTATTDTATAGPTSPTATGAAPAGGGTPAGGISPPG